VDRYGRQSSVGTSIIDVILPVAKYLFMGFAGFIVLLFVLALLFGKQVRKRWEFEAEFRDASGREFGEFDIEMSRIEKEEPDFRFKAKLRMRHDSLMPHDTVRVLVDDQTILEGMVEKAGRIFLGNDHIRKPLDQPATGQLCRVMVGSVELANATLVRD
jgi:hypothetical protein